MTQILPTDRAVMYIVADAPDAEPVHGTTAVGDATGVSVGLTVVQNEDENEFLGTVPADALEPLPGAGTWLEAGDLYADRGRAVMVRQNHVRTERAVDDLVPTLFLVWRENADSVLEWVAGESVVIGALRIYDGTTYRCKQAHVTQYTPDITPALWEEYQEPPTGDWVDSGETVTSLIGAGVIGVTDTAPFYADQPIRILGTEATVTRIHQAGAPGVLVIDPHIAVSGGEMIEVQEP
jgi:hypothetical protein